MHGSYRVNSGGTIQKHSAQKHSLPSHTTRLCRDTHTSTLQRPQIVDYTASPQTQLTQSPLAQLVHFFGAGRVLVSGCDILELSPEMTEWVMRVARPLAESVRPYSDVTVFSSDDYHTHPEGAQCQRGLFSHK